MAPPSRSASSGRLAQQLREEGLAPFSPCAPARPRGRDWRRRPPAGGGRHSRHCRDAARSSRQGRAAAAMAVRRPTESGRLPTGRTAPRSSCLPVARNRASAAISLPSSSRRRSPSSARAVRPRSTDRARVLGHAEQGGVEAAAGQAGRGAGQLGLHHLSPGHQPQPVDRPRAERRGVETELLQRRDRVPAEKAAADQVALAGTALDHHRHRPAPRQRDGGRGAGRAPADDQRSASLHPLPVTRSRPPPGQASRA